MEKENDYTTILENIWQQLERGRLDKKHPYKLGVFGTASAEGSDLRTVVVRKVRKTEGELWLYTDGRSPKVQQIQAENRIVWLFYHPRQMVQIRLYGTATTEQQTELCRTTWAQLPPHGRGDYLTKQPPSSPAAAIAERLPEDESANFCIIRTLIHRIDWLQLSREGHQRVLFEREGENWRATVLTP